MNDLIAISTLNDFIFCPYSIYLHQVYVDADEDMYHAKPQTRGRNAHDCDELTIPSLIVKNKIENQRQLLFNTRRKDSITQKSHKLLLYRTLLVISLLKGVFRVPRASI